MTKSGNHSHVIMIVALIMLVLTIVGGMIYSAYLFVDATHLSDIAGIHITKSFTLAAKDAQGNLYSNEAKGIKEWYIFEKDGIFRIKYPNSFRFQENEDGSIMIKEFSSGSESRSNALNLTVTVQTQALEGKSIQEIAVAKGIAWNDQWKEEEINKRIGIRTGDLKGSDGITREYIFWKDIAGKNVIIFEGTYYLEKHVPCKTAFNKILSEFELLK